MHSCMHIFALAVAFAFRVLGPHHSLGRGSDLKPVSVSASKRGRNHFASKRGRNHVGTNEKLEWRSFPLVVLGVRVCDPAVPYGSHTEAAGTPFFDDFSESWFVSP